jgi:transcription elongation factor
VPDFTAKMLKQLLYENKMLKIKLEKSAQAIATYEKENQRLKKELAKQKQTTAIASDKEVEMLSDSFRMKLVKHEQLRADVVKTVDSLKKQHALLTQAILSQQNLHEALSQNVSQSTD